MPWFPVVGNHDIYWRGDGQPAGEHEQDFEDQFGPLWYRFEHKQCWFVVLYSDEGDPVTGVNGLQRPGAAKSAKRSSRGCERRCEAMKALRHVFVFLHHPRWLSAYGSDWDGRARAAGEERQRGACSPATSTACATTA